VQTRSGKASSAARKESGNAHVTSAIGIEESYGRRRMKQTSLYKRTVLSLTGLICAALLLATLSQAWSNSNLMQRVQQQQQALQKVQSTNQQLNKNAQRYQDPATIESEARQQLGYIRPGEHPLVVINADNKGQSRIQPTTEKPPQPGHWQEWWRVFFS
jgi:Septum formation initiator